MGLPPERIVMHPGTASLGYGLEYEYSIMERIRLAGLQGDRMLSQPVITIVGEETWKAKEARLPESAMPELGRGRAPRPGLGGGNGRRVPAGRHGHRRPRPSGGAGAHEANDRAS